MRARPGRHRCVELRGRGCRGQSGWGGVVSGRRFGEGRPGRERPGRCRRVATPWGRVSGAVDAVRGGVGGELAEGGLGEAGRGILACRRECSLYFWRLGG